MKKKIKVELGVLNHPNTNVEFPKFSVPVSQNYEKIIGSAKLSKEGNNIIADTNVISGDFRDDNIVAINGRIEEMDGDIIKRFLITSISVIGKVFK